MTHVSCVPLESPWRPFLLCSSTASCLSSYSSSSGPKWLWFEHRRIIKFHLPTSALNIFRAKGQTRHCSPSFNLPVQESSGLTAQQWATLIVSAEGTSALAEHQSPPRSCWLKWELAVSTHTTSEITLGKEILMDGTLPFSFYINCTSFAGTAGDPSDRLVGAHCFVRDSAHCRAREA